MKAKKKRCRFCGRWYMPDPRTAHFQKSCNRKSCRKERRRQKMKDWAARHPDYQTYRNAKVRDWASARNYWKQYRASHPAYVRKDNKRRVLSRKRRKLSAKQTAMDRRINGLIDVLIWKEQSAKQTDIAFIASSVP